MAAHNGYFNFHELFILPTNVPANEFLNLEGQKMSTSRHWAVWLHEYLEDFPDNEDILRYCLITIMPENKDADFSWLDFQNKNNTELVANLGNFINRVFVLQHKYFEGIVHQHQEFSTQSQAVFKKVDKIVTEIEKAIEHYNFKEGMQKVMEISRLGNTYLAQSEPWKLIKTNPALTQDILTTVTILIQKISVVIMPFMPKVAHKIRLMLGLQITNINWNDNEGLLKLALPTLLFNKIDDETIMEQIFKLNKVKGEF